MASGTGGWAPGEACGCGCQHHVGIPFWMVGEFAHFRTYFSGDWNVHWGYGIFDPWPFLSIAQPLEAKRRTAGPPLAGRI